jgi:hypothetical protein
MTGNQNGRKYESTPSNARADMAAYKRAWRAAQKQQAIEAQGQTTIDQAYKKTKK